MDNCCVGSIVDCFHIPQGRIQRLEKAYKKRNIYLLNTYSARADLGTFTYTQ